MHRKIIIKPGRELTEKEINMLQRKKVIFSTQNISTLGHYDRFAGARIPSRIIGVYDNISCLICKVRKTESQENEYEVVFEETDTVRGLDRNHVGGSGGGYNMVSLEEQLIHLQETALSELLKDTNIIEQIQQKYEEEGKGYYFSTHHFYGDEQRKIFWDETLDILSNIHLRDKAQVEVINDDGSKRLLNIIKDEKDKGYMLIEFPCKMVLEFNGNKLGFLKCVSSEGIKIEETRESVINKISKINALLDLIPSYNQERYRYSFVMPEDISSEEELNRLMTEVEKTQLENIDIDELTIEEINELLGLYKSDYVFDSLIKEHDVEYILKRITNTNDNELKKRLMKSFSKKDGEYTGEQIESIKKTLIELLKDENGWEDNANVIAGFSKNFKSTLSFAEKMEILRMSIESHNNYCEQEEIPNLSGETYKNMREQRRQQNQINMRLSKLINELFADEEQSALVGELINQKNYQAMMMILKECKFDSKKIELPREDDKYSGISNEQKSIMVEELIEYQDKAPEGWLRYDKSYDLPYIACYVADKKQKQKTSTLEKIVGKKIFYIVERGLVEKSAEQQLKCFEDYRDEIEAFIDIEEAINCTCKGKLHIDIPEKYMGMMIGKQGRNIKKLQERLKELMDGGDIKIILHPQKEGHVITLQEIETFIEKQKTSELGEL